MDKMGETNTRLTNDAELWLWELAYHKPKKRLSPFMPQSSSISYRSDFIGGQLN